LFNPNLAAADWLILIIYGFFMLSAGFSLRPAIATSRDFMQAGRVMPGWLCAVSMLAAGLGSQQVLGMGAAGAHFGLAGIGFFMLGSVPAMLFASLYLMPVLYSAAPKALPGTNPPRVPVRSIPEYLGLRFDRKTRTLNAFMSAAMAAFSAGLGLYAMGRVFVALHIFDRVMNTLHLSPTGALLVAMALPAALILTYVMLGGLGAAMYNQTLQFFLAMAGLLPVVLLGLRKIGGWSGLKAAVPAGLMHEWSRAQHPNGVGAVMLAVAVGLVLGGGAWCADFRLLQIPMAARNLDSARRAPLLAAALCVFVPFVVVLPGLIAVGLPTPHTTIVIHNQNGAIVHDITVVPPAIEAGQGLVPAQAGADGQPVRDSHGSPILDYAMATPNMLLEFLPTGLLGLGIAALLACLMAGIAAGITAFSTVVTCDIFQSLFARDASDAHLLAVARWGALGGMIFAFAAACVALRCNNMLDSVMLIFAVVNVPLFSTLLLGAFWKRATGHGAFAGLIAGAVAALLHHGLDLPRGLQPGIHGGWIAALHHPPDQMVLDLGTAALAFVVSLFVAAIVSTLTKPRPESELAGLVYSLVPQSQKPAVWTRRPEALAAAILLAAIAVNLVFI
jgi:SSS family solute:Na+ symporter